MSQWRRVLRAVHLWMALVLCVPFVLIGLSGSALLLQREILRLTGPAASASGEAQSVERMVAAARAAVAAEARASWIDLPVGPRGAAIVQFELGRRPTRRVDVAVDPVSLQVLGASDYVRRGPIKSVLVDIHEYLMMPMHVGFPFVGWMGVALTLMGLSGIVLWWPRRGQWRAGFMLRRGTRGLRLHVDLHRVAGIWGLLMLLALSVSGIYLTFPATVTAMVKAVLPSELLETDSDVAGSPHPGPIDHDHVVKAARLAVTDAVVTGLQLPGAGNRPYVVQMEPVGFGPSTPAIMVTIDPKTAAVSYIDDPRAHPPAERVLNLLHALHFSVGLGRVWTVLVFLAGLLPLFLAVTGLSIWWRTRRARRRAGGQKEIELPT